jgi:acetylornithine deacetylase/succinyl-diaminopimelate desuccinylase-like protein
LRGAIEDFLAEHDPEAGLVPALAYGYSDCDVMRRACGSTAYGFVPFRHANPLDTLCGKHGLDEHVRIDDLVFQTEAALAIARSVAHQTR